jgi:hypothetical protein
MIWVPREVEGMEIVPIETMGGRETNTLYFTDCVAPESAVLGQVDQGWTQLMAGLNVERLILAATMLGIAQRAFDDALAYAKERKQFGRPIGTFQTLQHRFADLATDLEAARLMTRWVATMTDEDPNRMLPQEASMVKLFVTEVAKRTTLEGMQMMGGYGYSAEYDMERSSAPRSSPPSTAAPPRSSAASSPKRSVSDSLSHRSARALEGRYSFAQPRALGPRFFLVTILRNEGEAWLAEMSASRLLWLAKTASDGITRRTSHGEIRRTGSRCASSAAGVATTRPTRRPGSSRWPRPAHSARPSAGLGKLRSGNAPTAGARSRAPSTTRRSPSPAT